jgi:hypothetical protein
MQGEHPDKNLQIKVKRVVKNLYKRHFITDTITITSKNEVSILTSYDDMHKIFRM